MIQTTVSTKYQIVIPREVRKKIQVKPGEKFNVNVSGEEIILSQARLAARLTWPYDYLKNLKNPWQGTKTIDYLEKERSSWE